MRAEQVWAAGSGVLAPAGGTAGVLACEWRGVRAPAVGPGGETPPELAGGDACGTGGSAAVLGCEWRGVRASAIGPGGETPPELAGGDACGTGVGRGLAAVRTRGGGAGLRMATGAGDQCAETGSSFSMRTAVILYSGVFV